MASELVRVEEHRGVGRIVMTAGANALDLSLMESLRAAVASLRSRAMPFALTSAHPGIFCPGWDLKKLATAGRPLVKEFLTRFNDLILDVFAYPGPTVAMIAGHAIAGGCLLAMACDVRVMTSGPARIGQSEVNLGVPVPAESLVMLRSRLAPGVVEEVVFRCDGYTAERAHRLGLIQQAVEPGRGETVAEQELRTLAAKPQQAYRQAKRFLHERAWLAMRGGREDVSDVFLDSWFEAGTQARVQGMAGLLRG
jgi:enoyl-CoA hydratase